VLACTLSARNYFSSFADCREDAFFHALADGIEIQTPPRALKRDLAVA
jgi:hypothetical protein